MLQEVQGIAELILLFGNKSYTKNVLRQVHLEDGLVRVWVELIHESGHRTPGAAEWPYVLVVDLDDMAAVQRYAEHPAHVDVVQRVVAPIRAARLAVDVEVPA